MGEGFAASLLGNITCKYFFSTFVRFLRRRNNCHKNQVFFVQKICRDIWKRLLAYFLLAIHLVLAYAVYAMYLYKSPWYGPRFDPPVHYVKGPLSNDQGVSIPNQPLSLPWILVGTKLWKLCAKQLIYEMHTQKTLIQNAHFAILNRVSKWW